MQSALTLEHLRLCKLCVQLVPFANCHARDEDFASRGACFVVGLVPLAQR